MGDELRRRRDVVVASDPGMNRLIAATEAGIGIGACLAVVYGFIQWTHLMWIATPTGTRLSAGQLAAIDAQHHGLTLLAMLVGGIVGLMGAFAVQETRPREQALTLSLLPIPMLASMALAIWLAPHHAVGVAVMALVMGLGTWCRRFVPRFGPRAFLYGVLLFNGYIIGFLSAGTLKESYLGDLALVLYVSALVTLAVKVLFTNPLARGRLNRTAMAFRARSRSVIAAAVALFDARTADERDRARRTLHRRLGRLNETALVIDASLAQADRSRLGASAAGIHDELFELELTVQNMARIAERLADAELPAPLRREVRTWLEDCRAGRVQRAAVISAAVERGEDDELLADLDAETAARVHRLAMTIVAAAEAVRDFPHSEAPGDEILPAESFTSPVTLMFGDLPGSALVAAGVATRTDASLPWFQRLAPPSQAAIRMAIAVGLAGGIGSAISERRFYWAVIAVFITFMGTNTSGEQITKAVNRIGGTVIGILVGSLLAHAIGHSTWSIAVVIGALMIGMYFMKLSYAVFVIAITITVSQLYVQLGEFSNSLLLLRLGETAVGATVAVACALLIFPVRTRRVISAAAIGYVRALGDLLSGVQGRLDGDGETERLSTSVRALDYAAQQFVAASRPLRLTPFRPDRLEHNVALLTQSAHQARNIVADVQHPDRFSPGTREWFGALVYTERAAVSRLDDLLSGQTPSAPAHRVDDGEIAALDRALADAEVPFLSPQRRLLFQLDRLDETLAELHDNVAGVAE